jgi:hypothetical protein
MANPTTNFGWQMPTSVDLVTDLPADFEVFGQAVDTDFVGLKGGTTGQVLAKASGTDLDFVWSADAAGMANPMTTTGDIIYSSSGSTPARLGIGTDGQVLEVSGGLPTWTTPASTSPASASANVSTSESTTSTSYTDLTTAGPAVTITTGTKALVIVSARLEVNTGASSYASYAVSGATTIAASDNVAVEAGTITTGMSRASRLTTLTAGSNTFTMKYRTSPTRTGTFESREIIVIDLGS